MKIILSIFLFFLFSTNTSKADIAHWEWKNNFNGYITNIEYHNDYLYTVGVYADSAFNFGNFNYANNGGSDVIVIKWDTLGNLIWANNIYGAQNEQGVSIKVNSANEVIVCGYSNSSTINVSGNLLISNGGYDTYIAKYDLNGNYVGAYLFGNAADNIATCMCTDYANNIYISYPTSVSKYSNAGIYIWAQGLQNPQDQIYKEVHYSSIDSTLIVTGLFKNTLVIGNFSVTAVYSFQWGVQPDVFIEKLSANNVPLWLVNSSEDYRGNYGVKTYIQQQTGIVFNAYTRPQMGDYILVINKITSSGVKSNTNMFAEDFTIQCASISGNDSLLSFVDWRFNGPMNSTCRIYNTSTQQLIRKYDSVGIANDLNASFHCFRNLHAIYGIGYNITSFGKVDASVLIANPSLQNKHFCLDSLATLSGNISGGKGAYTYSWAPATGLNNTNTNVVSFTATSNISYTLTVTDSIGQIAKDTFNVIIDVPIPPANITPQFPLLCDIMELYANNGIAGNWYYVIGLAWATPPGQFGNFGVLQKIITDGKYIYTAQNACGLRKDSIEISKVLNVLPNASDDTICLGQSVTLTGSGASFYAWTAGVQDGMPFFPFTTQSYLLTGTDTSGCIDTASIRIVVSELPTINGINATPNTICDLGNTLIMADTSNYCIPTIFNPPSSEAIVNFTFGIDINNNTGQVPLIYTYYNNLTANVVADSTYPISITKNMGGTSAESRTVWIDYNHDGDFDDMYELTFFKDTSALTVTGNIHIPANAHNGITRMRVGGKWYGINTPCYNDSYGEYEDYNLNISGGVDHLTCSPLTFVQNITGNHINIVAIDTTTTYIISVKDLKGCVYLDSITINVNPNSFSFDNDTICSNLTPYLWQGQSLTNSGIYTSVQVAANGCDSIITLNLTVIPCLNPNINELEENTSLLIFPNPTTGILNIKHRASVTYIKLIDRVGSLIIQKLCSGAQTTQIDMSQLANGIYYIKADGYAPMKVIKKK